MAANKTAATGVDPTVFIEGVDNFARRADRLILLNVFEQWTGEPAKMWGPGMIGFGQYHYKYESGREGDLFLTGFAPRNNEMVVCLLGKIEGQAELLKRLGKHRMGRACLYIKQLEQVDMAVLEELVRKSVAALKAKYSC